jgi:hypothetical protein
MFRALEQLYALGALNDRGELTTLGALRWQLLCCACRPCRGLRAAPRACVRRRHAVLRWSVRPLGLWACDAAWWRALLGPLQTFDPPPPPF